MERKKVIYLLYTLQTPPLFPENVAQLTTVCGVCVFFLRVFLSTYYTPETRFLPCLCVCLRVRAYMVGPVRPLSSSFRSYACLTDSFLLSSIFSSVQCSQTRFLPCLSVEVGPLRPLRPLSSSFRSYACLSVPYGFVPIVFYLFLCSMFTNAFSAMFYLSVYA